MEDEQPASSPVGRCPQARREAEAAFDQALQQTRQVRLRNELAAAHVDLQQANRCQELGTRVEQVGTLQAESTPSAAW